MAGGRPAALSRGGTLRHRPRPGAGPRHRARRLPLVARPDHGRARPPDSLPCRRPGRPHKPARSPAAAASSPLCEQRLAPRPGEQGPDCRERHTLSDLHSGPGPTHRHPAADRNTRRIEFAVISAFSLQMVVPILSAVNRRPAMSFWDLIKPQAAGKAEAAPKPAGSAELAVALEEAEAAAAEAIRLAAEVAERRQTFLIGGTDDQLDHLDRELAGANRSVDKCEAAMEALQARLADAVERERREG